MSGSIKVPAPGVSLIDRAGSLTLVGRSFFNELLNRIGGNTGGLANLNGNSNEVFNVANAQTGTQAVPLDQLAVIAGAAVETITVGTSPFTYQAPRSGVLAIGGSGVVRVQVVRNGVTATLDRHYGAVPVRYQDQVILTYSQAVPTLTWLPN